MGCHENVGISDDIAKEIDVSPNPFDEVISVKVPRDFAKDANVFLYDVFGKELLNVNKQLDDNYIYLTEMGFLSTGVYIVEIRINEKQFFKRVVKL